ncbi:MAG: DUF3667 domain-containing protein [Steroidobacteraceae bacterium]
MSDVPAPPAPNGGAVSDPASAAVTTAPPTAPTELPDVAETPFCRNCGAPLAGTYCADCGQKGDVHVPSTHELIHEALEGITHSDSRLWTTMKYLLFVPGRLTNEYIAGRRAAYLPPFRLYLVMSVLFFLLVPLSGSGGKDVTIESANEPQANGNCTDVHSDLGPGVEAFARRACKGIVKDHGERLIHDTVAYTPKAMFVFLPLIAFLHMLMYWWPRQRYAVHLLFFVHVHAFAFLAFVLMWALGETAAMLPRLAGTAQVLEAALALWIPVYIVLAMRRVFRRSRWNTLMKATTLFFGYICVLAITLLAVAAYAAWRV